MARNKYPEITRERILDTSLRLFLNKGYEHTTIQDIVNDLKDLSKGAIYHHFKSKEDIIDAVAGRLYEGSNEQIMRLLEEKEQSTGLENIRKLFWISLNNQNQMLLLKAAPDLMKNPRFLAMQVKESVEEIGPGVMQPFIEQGIQDGSIQGDSPREMSQVLALLANIWVNPAIFHVSAEELFCRFKYLQKLLEQLGMPVVDDKMLQVMLEYRTVVEESRGQGLE